MAGRSDSDNNAIQHGWGLGLAELGKITTQDDKKIT